MSGAQTITFNPTLEAAVVAVVVGAIAFWSNPRRSINRAFFTGSLHVAFWLVCLGMALRNGAHGQTWLRTTTAVGAFIPLHLWFMKEMLVGGVESRRALLRRSAGWALACTLLAALTMTEWFVTTQSSREAPGIGWGYHLYTGGIIAVYVALSYQTLRQSRVQVGVNRLELQIVLIGGSLAAVAVILLMGLRAVLAIPGLILLQPLVILTFYTGMVIAITTSRIFDARQILLVGLRKLALVASVTLAAYLLDGLLTLFLPEPFAFVATTAVALWFAGVTSHWLDRVFHSYPEATAARQAAFAVTRREIRIETMEKAFMDILKGWGQSDHALLLAGAKGPLIGGGLELPEDSPVLKSIRQLRWATPERLMRERSSSDRETLKKFLLDHGLGALVVGEGPTLTVLVGVGVAASRQPFTYPQVTQLMELASIIENALERAHFSVKAQRAEQLATVGLLGASLAHEIRNPLVSIKAFVQLLPQHYQDPAFRDKFFRLIGDEVMRIERLTEQLLDLASPRVYAAQIIELHPVLRSSLELSAAKAADKRIPFFTDFQAAPDRVYTDASAAKQVILNLCFNAIQAVEAHPGERWVKLSTRNVADGVEVLLEDSGPGISPEIRPRLFQPFQSTKSSGFGLGLAICSDILSGLDATISVDPAVPGRGATFRIVFPCQA